SHLPEILLCPTRRSSDLPENALEAVHEHVLNNMILGSVTMDMAYAKAFIDDVDHFGYYWRGNFYLHRIKRVEDSHINETVTVTRSQEHTSELQSRFELVC